MFSKFDDILEQSIVKLRDGSEDLSQVSFGEVLQQIRDEHRELHSRAADKAFFDNITFISGGTLVGMGLGIAVGKAIDGVLVANELSTEASIWLAENGMEGMEGVNLPPAAYTSFAGTFLGGVSGWSLGLRRSIIRYGRVARAMIEVLRERVEKEGLQPDLDPSIASQHKEVRTHLDKFDRFEKLGSIHRNIQNALKIGFITLVGGSCLSMAWIMAGDVLQAKIVALGIVPVLFAMSISLSGKPTLAMKAKFTLSSCLKMIGKKSETATV